MPSHTNLDPKADNESKKASKLEAALEIQQNLFKMPPIGGKGVQTKDIKQDPAKMSPKPKASTKPKPMPKGPITILKREPTPPANNNDSETIKVRNTKAKV